MRKTFLKNIILFVVILLLLTPFFSGGENFFVKNTAFICIDIIAIIFIFNFKKPEKLNLNLKNIFTSPYLYLTLFLLGGIVNIIYSIYPLGSLIQYFNYLNYFLLFFLLSNLKLNPKEIKLLLKSFLSVSLLVCVIGFYFFLTGNYDRLTSTFYWPNPLAAFLIFSLFISLYFLTQAKNKSLYLLSTVVIASSLFLTKSEGAWLAIILSSLFILIWYLYSFKHKINKKQLLSFSLKVIFLIVFVLSALNLTSDKPIFSLDKIQRSGQLNESNQIRLEYYEAGIELFFQAPVIGQGLDTFSKTYPQVQTSPIYAGKYVHNWYLELLLETGIFLTLFFLAFLIFSLFKYKPKFLSLKFFILPALIAYLVHSLVDINNHYLANNIMFFSLLGLFNNNLGNFSIKYTHWSRWIKTVIIITAATSLIFFVLFIRNQLKINNLQEPNNLNWLYTSSHKQSLARYFLDIKDYDSAETIITHSISQDTFNYRNYELLANLKLKQKEYQTAENYYQKALNLNPYILRLYTQLAIAQLKQNDVQSAQNTIEKAMDIYSDKVVDNQKLKIMENQAFFSNLESEYKELKQVKELVEKKLKS